MSGAVSIEKYTHTMEERWDRFVLNDSINGTILQTRKFLNYHQQGRFVDNSLVVMNGSNIIAVIPANYIRESNEIISHQGSTYGGIVLAKNSNKINVLDSIFLCLDNYLNENKISRVTFNQTGTIYQRYPSKLLDYYYYLNGYVASAELGYYIDLKETSENVIDGFSSSRRRDYRYSLRNKFEFKELCDNKEIADFYHVLCDNYKKFNTSPVHTLDEIMDLHQNRINGYIRFYGVYNEDVLVAGAMIFIFDNHVFHTQYLAVRQDSTNMFINEFLYTNLIFEAKKELFNYISFGTAVLEHGKILNRSLAQYKEGYGTNTYINYRYSKSFEIGE